MKSWERFLLAAVLPLAVCNGQISFSSTDVQALFAVGKYWQTYEKRNDTGVTIGTMNIGSPSSSNAQAWSLPSITLTDTSRADLVSPGSTPFAAYFPGATVVQKTVKSTSSIYEYYRITADSLISLGTADTIQGVSSIMSLRHSAVILIPASLGGTFTSRDSFPGKSGWFTIDRRTSTWDAYGTLTCPGGTFQTLRLKEFDINYQYNNLGVLQRQDTSYHFTWSTKEGYFVGANENGPNQTASGTVNLNELQYTAVRTATGINDARTFVPGDFVLGQNFPNPFNPSTTIRYGLPTRSQVRLVVYNLLGQVVAQLVNADQAAGWNQVVWNADVSSGLYFYKLTAVSVDDPLKRFANVKRMVLLK